MTTAVAPSARPAARHPPYRGYVGPAAVGLRDAGLAGRDDVLDLGEAELYRNPRSPEDLVPRGPALALFVACTGATVEELPEITYDPERPLRDWIDLPGDGLVAARTVPLPELAAIALRNYRRLADKITTCDRLFVDSDGGPTSRLSIRKQFTVVGERIGIAGARLLTALHHAYIAWTDASPDKDTAAYLRGYGFAHRTPPDRIPSPSNRKKLIEAHHPLGKLDRDMLRWQGAVARRDAAHPLRELSAATKKALAEAKRARTSYPDELKEAVREALASGREPKAVYAHYGVSFRILYDYVPRARKNPLAAFEPLEAVIRAKLEGPRTTTGEDMVAWLESEHGLVVPEWKLRRQLKEWGLAGRLRRARPSVVDPHLDEIRATIPDGGVADLDLVAGLLVEKGVTITTEALRSSLRARGIPLATVPTVAFTLEVEIDVRAWISVYPPPSLETICRRLEAEHRISMSPHQVSARIKAMGVVKAPGRASPELRAIGPYLPEIKAHAIANPTKTWAAIAAWARAEFDVAIEARTLQPCMVRLGVNKRGLAGEARKSACPPAARGSEAAGRAVAVAAPVRKVTRFHPAEGERR
ncbi:hypothetical protein ACQR1W_12785 [Bradyrhizobium sp. HKCCYLS1011]